MTEDTQIPGVRFEVPEPRFYARTPALVILDKELSVSAKCLYTYYAHIAGVDSRPCREGITAVAEQLGMNKNQVSKARRELAERDYIKVERVLAAGGRWVHQVILSYIWDANIARYDTRDIVILGYEDLPREEMNVSQLKELWKANNNLWKNRER